MRDEDTSGGGEALVRSPDKGGDGQRRPWSLLLFLLPVGAVIVPQVYSRLHPSIANVSFFIWYQFVVVVFGAVITAAVYLLRGTERTVEKRRAPGPAPLPQTGASASSSPAPTTASASDNAAPTEQQLPPAESR